VLESEETRAKGAEFQGMMRDSYNIAMELEAIITEEPFDTSAVDNALSRLDNSCAICRAFYRN
jgi:cytochrome c556